jgi:hypothetical protein
VTCCPTGARGSSATRQRAALRDPRPRLALLHPAAARRVGRRRRVLHAGGVVLGRPRVADPDRDRQPSGAAAHHPGGAAQHRRRQAHPRDAGQPARPVQAQHRRALRPVERAVRAVPRRHDDLLGAYFERPDRHPRGGPGGEVPPAGGEGRIDADCHVLEIGCGWGGFAIFAARPTAAGSPASPCPRSRPPTPGAGASRGARPPRRHPDRRLPRGRPAASTASCRSRCSRRSATATSAPTSRPSTGCSPPTGSPPSRSSPSPSSATTTTAAGPTSSSATSSPAATCRRSRR